MTVIWLLWLFPLFIVAAFMITTVPGCTDNVSYVSVNPLTAGTDYIHFLHFSLAYCISAFKHVKDK